MIIGCGRRVETVVPFAVPGVTGEAGLLQLPHLPVGDLHALGIGALVEQGLDFRPTRVVVAPVKEPRPILVVSPVQSDQRTACARSMSGHWIQAGLGGTPPAGPSAARSGSVRAADACCPAWPAGARSW